MKPEIASPAAEPAWDLLRQVDTHGCELSDEELHRMYASMDGLARQAVNFPIHDLKVMVERNHRSNDFSVKLTLQLAGKTLVVSEHDAQAMTAFEQGLVSLERQIEHYKSNLGQVSERQKAIDGTHKLIQPTVDPDQSAVDAAVEQGDYTAFRTALMGYEDPLRVVLGRHLEGHPEWDAQIRKRFQIGDVLEEVFLDAFEGYERRPREVRFGEWLTHLIDPAVKELMTNTDGELENIRMARSAREAALGKDI